MVNEKKSSRVPSKASFIKAVGVLYGALVGIVLVALVYVLQSDNAIVDIPIEDPAVDAEIQAMLAAIDGRTSVAVQTASAEPAYSPKSASLAAEETPIPAWQSHASDRVAKTGPQIAIVIDDLGLSEQASLVLADMQGPYTLAYLPYAENLLEQTARVKRAGHELLVHMPMQPKNNEDPGPNALLTELPADEFERRIDWNLDRFEGFVGINNHMGSHMTEQAGLMVRLMVHLRRDGLLFLDSLTSPRSVAARAAIATGVPVVERDIFLDNERTMAAIMEQLTKTEVIARQRGYAIAIGHPYDVTLKALEFWQAGLATKNITLVPLSQIVTDRENMRLHAEKSIEAVN